MEKTLLKKLLNREFYFNNKLKLKREFFPQELGDLFDTITQAHDRYEAPELKPEWVRKLHTEFNPGLTVAAIRNISILLDDVVHEDDCPDAMAADILLGMWKRNVASGIAQKAVDIINGDETEFTLLQNALSELQEVQEEIPQNYTEVPFDLDEFLKLSSNEGLFPFRLSPLKDQVYGAGRGNFVIVFARPEAGKTTYTCFETAGFLQNGLRVDYYANEEPAHRVYARVVCSALERSMDEIRADVAEARDAFHGYSKLLTMRDCVGMDITEVSNLCTKGKPDVVILDQLDKFGVHGNFSRGDERLGELYVQARQIAKKHNCLVIAVSQCSAEGEGLNKIDFSMLAGSKTGKAAEGDLIIGIGRNPLLEGTNEDIRQFNVSKNKVNGWHGYVTAMLDRHRAIYEV